MRFYLFMGITADIHDIFTCQKLLAKNEHNESEAGEVWVAELPAPSEEEIWPLMLKGQGLVALYVTTHKECIALKKPGELLK